MKARKLAAETWVYVPLVDRELPYEEQTRIVCRPLTLAQHARLVDNLSRTDVGQDGRYIIHSRAHQEAIRVCIENIESVENFPSDAPKEWPKGRDDRLAYLDLFGIDIVLEIGNEIFGRSTLGDDAKNSLPPGRTSSSGGDSEGRASTTAVNAGSA